MWIAHIDKVRLLREVTGVEQALLQQIVSTVKEVYFTDIRNRTTNSINDTAAEVLNHLQDSYGKLMPHDLLARKDIVKKTIYFTRDPIVTVFSAVEELLKFDNIAGTSYTQYQAVNIEYVIIHRMGKFGLAIREWNRMTTVQKTWVKFNQFSIQHTENSEKPPTSPWKTPAFTTQTRCVMWWHSCRKSCSSKNSQRIIRRSLKHQ